LAGVNPVYGLYSGIVATMVASLTTGTILMISTLTSAIALATGSWRLWMSAFYMMLPVARARMLTFLSALSIPLQYTIKSGFQRATGLDRLAIGDRDTLKYNADGSLGIYFQHDNPGPDKTSSWLPAPGMSGTCVCASTRQSHRCWTVRGIRRRCQRCAVWRPHLPNERCFYLRCLSVALRGGSQDASLLQQRQCEASNRPDTCDQPASFF
jgi:hypothetical protein